MIDRIRRLLGLAPRAGRTASSPSVPTTPTDCPACSGNIARDPADAAFYVCTGLGTSAEAAARWRERFPSLEPPKALAPVAACGWRDRADAYGTGWW